MTRRAAPTPDPDARWVLIRDVLVFQVKLLIDGLRDAVLIPVSLVAATLDLVGGRERTGRLFYATVAQGRRSERWIDLFEAARRSDAGRSDRALGEGAGVDELVAKLEGLLVEQHARGGITASAKDAIDRALDALPTARSGGRGDPKRQ